ncbi:ATP-binding protein [Streptomyces sp. NPDC048483]|uniref:ATP-binding protein n=1 Tax=Streptomyces sp. NPDC048483 TaxID=3154927 RepID=UPI0034211EA4
MKNQHILAAPPTARDHELANCLHTLAGLLDLEMYARARQFVAERSGDPAPERDRAPEPHLPQERWPEPLLHVLLAGKRAAAVDAAAAHPAAKPLAEVGMWAEPGATVLSVADNGPGVPTTQRAAVFRDGWSTKEAPPHRQRGVGLTLVHGVARRYGGSARMTERPGGGAVFTDRLPRNPPVAAGVAP